MSALESQHFLKCSFTFEIIADTGEVLNRKSSKQGNVVLGRNEYGCLLMSLDGGKIKETFLLNNFLIHKKFLNDGKASITFPQKKRRVFLFNCPSDKLFEFLNLLYVKNEVQKETPKLTKPIKQKALMALQTSFNEISPLTARDINIMNSKFCKNGGQIKRKAEFTPKNKENYTPSKNNSNSGNKYSNKPKAKRQLNMINQNTPTNSHNKSPSKILSFIKPSKNEEVLSTEQMGILSSINAKCNIFITGSAGTGKSFILRKIIRRCPPQSTFVTASTALAACHLQGSTIHAFAGIGTGAGSMEDCLKLASKHPSNWKACKILIIDEISMISGDYFDKLEAVARVIRKNDKPFGGIQLVLCGDFLQLPPVNKQQHKSIFAFQSTAWDRCKLQCHQLKQVHRQKDVAFVSLLNSIRLGICTIEMEKVLKSTGNKINTDKEVDSNTKEKNSIEANIIKHVITATKLCTHKQDVDLINMQQLNKLNTASKTYSSRDHPTSSSSILDATTPTTASLTLKIGAQVMLTKNIRVSDGLVNGSRGVVVALNNKDNDGPVVRLLSGAEHVIRVEKWVVHGVGGVKMVRVQLPLKLAWALSIHKSQGMTLDLVEVCLSKVFEAGQAYVALSRARSLDALKVVQFDRKCIMADENVLNFYNNLC